MDEKIFVGIRNTMKEALSDCQYPPQQRAEIVLHLSRGVIGILNELNDSQAKEITDIVNQAKKLL